MRIRVSIQRNHLFCKTNTQKTVAKVKILCTEEKPSFVYLCFLCIGAKKSQPYLEEPIRLPSPHGINFSIHQSVPLSVQNMKTCKIFT